MPQGIKKSIDTLAPNQEYLETLENHSSKKEPDLETYIREFDLDPEALSPEDQFVFYLAKKAHFALDEIRLKRSAVFQDEERDSPIPADNMDVGIVENPEEVASALSSELAMEEIAPELFYKKLLAGETLKREWREKYKRPMPATGDEKQYTHVLLDVSGSMDSKDGRGAMARALAIAFLKKGCDEGAQFLLRPFAGSPGNLLKGEEQHELTDIVRTLLRLSMDDGGTDIQEALERAVADIEADGEFGKADLLLLTDGESKMGENPLGKVDLHTIIVGGDRYSKEVEEWSKTFRRIVPQGEVNLSANEEDVEKSRNALRALKEEFENLTDIKEIENFKQKLRKKKELLEKIKAIAPSQKEQDDKLGELIKEIDDTVNEDSTTTVRKNREIKKQKERKVAQKKKESDDAIKELRKKIAAMQGKNIDEEASVQDENGQQPQDTPQEKGPGGQRKGQGGERQKDAHDSVEQGEQGEDKKNKRDGGDKEKELGSGEERKEPQNPDKKKDSKQEKQKQDDENTESKPYGTGKWRFVQKAYRWVRKHIWKKTGQEG